MTHPNTDKDIDAILEEIRYLRRPEQRIALLALIQKREQEAVNNKIQTIVSNNYDYMHMTYDYDGIAEDVLTAFAKNNNKEDSNDTDN